MFETVAAGGPPRCADAVRAFGRRDDIRPRQFGFAIVDTPEGPSTSRRSSPRDGRAGRRVRAAARAARRAAQVLADVRARGRGWQRSQT